MAQLDPTVDELADLRTAISEAVTNCIVHAYRPYRRYYIRCVFMRRACVTVKIRDKGCGIEDVELAMEPLYTTGGEDRSGLGFFCDGKLYGPFEGYLQAGERDPASPWKNKWRAAAEHRLRRCSTSRKAGRGPSERYE